MDKKRLKKYIPNKARLKRIEERIWERFVDRAKIFRTPKFGHL